jgi:hypothetical protein
MPTPLRGALKDNPVPSMCWECGKALAGRQRKFCSNECGRAFPLDQLTAPVESSETAFEEEIERRTITVSEP